MLTVVSCRLLVLSATPTEVTLSVVCTVKLTHPLFLFTYVIVQRYVNPPNNSEVTESEYFRGKLTFCVRIQNSPAQIPPSDIERTHCIVMYSRDGLEDTCVSIRAPCNAYSLIRSDSEARGVGVVCDDSDIQSPNVAVCFPSWGTENWRFASVPPVNGALGEIELESNCFVLNSKRCGGVRALRQCSAEFN